MKMHICKEKQKKEGNVYQFDMFGHKWWSIANQVENLRLDDLKLIYFFLFFEELSKIDRLNYKIIKNVWINLFMLLWFISMYMKFNYMLNSSIPILIIAM